MKKLLVVLLALTVVGVFAFADDAAAAPAAPTLTFSGSVKTGAQVDVKQYADKATLKLWESDDPAASYLYFDGTVAGTNAGAKFEIAAPAVATTVVTDTLYGWYSPISMLKLSAGKGYDVVYETPIEGWDNGQQGVQLKLSPIAGLDLGAEYHVATISGTAANGSADEIDASRIQATAKFALPDLLTIGANADFQQKSYIFGVNVTALKALTAI